MNEKELTHLMKGYGESMNGFSAPPLSRRPLRNTRWAVVAVAVASIAFILQLPRPAEASEYKRMETALSQVSTMHMKTWLYRSSGRVLESEGWYQGGDYRYDMTPWGGVPGVWIRKANGRFCYSHPTERVSVELADDAPDQTSSLLGGSVLEFAIKATKHTDSREPDNRVMTTKRAVGKDGKPTWVVTLSESTPDQTAWNRTTIVTDAKSHLPITVEEAWSVDRKGPPNRRVTTYDFGLSLPHSAFDPLYQPIIQSERATADVIQTLSPSVVSVDNEMNILRAEVGPTGLLYLLIAGRDRPTITTPHQSVSKALIEVSAKKGMAMYNGQRVWCGVYSLPATDVLAPIRVSVNGKEHVLPIHSCGAYPSFTFPFMFSVQLDCAQGQQLVHQASQLAMAGDFHGATALAMRAIKVLRPQRGIALNWYLEPVRAALASKGDSADAERIQTEILQ